MEVSKKDDCTSFWSFNISEILHSHSTLPLSVELSQIQPFHSPLCEVDYIRKPAQGSTALPFPESLRSKVQKTPRELVQCFTE